jgi:hypothetical protein
MGRLVYCMFFIPHQLEPSLHTSYLIVHHSQWTESSTIPFLTPLTPPLPYQAIRNARAQQQREEKKFKIKIQTVLGLVFSSIRDCLQIKLNCSSLNPQSPPSFQFDSFRSIRNAKHIRKEEKKQRRSDEAIVERER